MILHDEPSRVKRTRMVYPGKLRVVASAQAACERFNRPCEVPMHAQFGLQLLVATFCRFLLKTGRHLVDLFAASFGAGSGVSLAAITGRLALNQAAGMFGPLSDRCGYRTMMVVGLHLASLAMLAVRTNASIAKEEGTAK